MHPSSPTPPLLPFQVLSDVVESLVGAVYVDSCGDMDVVWAVAQVGAAWGLNRVAVRLGECAAAPALGIFLHQHG